MKENDYVYHMHPVHEFGNVETSKLLIARLTEDMPVEERLRVVAYSPMFTFWSEIQNALLAAADEISRLNKIIESTKQ
jgi:hypothetical protein